MGTMGFQYRPPQGPDTQDDLDRVATERLTGEDADGGRWIHPQHRYREPEPPGPGLTQEELKEEALQEDLKDELDGPSNAPPLQRFSLFDFLVKK